AHYRASLAGEPDPLPPLSLQYGDFASWQRQWLKEGALAEQLAYWKGRLAGAAPALELPADRPRPAGQTFRGAQQTFELSAELAGSLRELARREGCSLFMVLLTAFQGLLSRYTGQEDVCVGT